LAIFHLLLTLKFCLLYSKTSLRMAMSRIKLLQNKRDNQLKVLRKEIAQLLSSGQDTSAAIRVILCPQVPSMSFPFQLFHSFSPLLCCIWNYWSSIQQHIQSICPSPMRQAFCQSLDSSFVLNKKLFNISLYLWSTDGSMSLNLSISP
jgi:hypothetical protein